MQGANRFTRRIRTWMLALPLLLLAGGCATPRVTKDSTTALKTAQDMIPQADLLDVGIRIFNPGELTEKAAKKEGTNEEIRGAESHFIPFHLKQTLQRTGYFGSVYVLPLDTKSTDILVSGEILFSNGEELRLEVSVSDSMGYRWFKKEYEALVKAESFNGMARGEYDLFQDVYNRIANDIIAEMNRLPIKDLHRIREVTRLQFAEQFSPEAFGGYLSKDDRGRVEIKRLPAENDPQLARIMKIQERDALFVETLNQYYEVLYRKMWTTYENWRKFNLTEIEARKEVRRSAITQQITGVLLIALAVALELGDVDNVNTLRDVLVLSGGQVLINGINVSKQTEMHATALQELADSFSADARPIKLELEGRVLDLSGTAEEKYATWRELLRRLYVEETGFEALPAPPPSATETTGTATP